MTGVAKEASYIGQWLPHYSRINVLFLSKLRVESERRLNCGRKMEKDLRTNQELPNLIQTRF